MLLVNEMKHAGKLLIIICNTYSQVFMTVVAIKSVKPQQGHQHIQAYESTLLY